MKIMILIEHYLEFEVLWEAQVYFSKSIFVFTNKWTNFRNFTRVPECHVENFGLLDQFSSKEKYFKLKLIIQAAKPKAKLSEYAQKNFFEKENIFYTIDNKIKKIGKLDTCFRVNFSVTENKEIFYWNGS